ncbi:HTH-type transcriptional repressor yvoA, partial [Dysosmobacter welbionis]
DDGLQQDSPENAKSRTCNSCSSGKAVLRRYHGNLAPQPYHLHKDCDRSCNQKQAQQFAAAFQIPDPLCRRTALLNGPQIKIEELPQKQYRRQEPAHRAKRIDQRNPVGCDRHQKGKNPPPHRYT